MIICAFFLWSFFVIIFYIMLLIWERKLSLKTKVARGVANEIDNVIKGKLIIIGNLNLTAFLAFTVQARKSISLRWSTIIYKSIISKQNWSDIDKNAAWIAKHLCLAKQKPYKTHEDYDKYSEVTSFLSRTN